MLSRIFTLLFLLTWGSFIKHFHEMGQQNGLSLYCLETFILTDGDGHVPLRRELHRTKRGNECHSIQCCTSSKTWGSGLTHPQISDQPHDHFVRGKGWKIRPRSCDGKRRATRSRKQYDATFITELRQREKIWQVPMDSAEVLSAVSEAPYSNNLYLQQSRT